MNPIKQIEQNKKKRCERWWWWWWWNFISWCKWDAEWYAGACFWTIRNNTHTQKVHNYYLISITCPPPPPPPPLLHTQLETLFNVKRKKKHLQLVNRLIQMESQASERASNHANKWCNVYSISQVADDCYAFFSPHLFSFARSPRNSSKHFYRMYQFAMNLKCENTAELNNKHHTKKEREREKNSSWKISLHSS